MKRMTAVCLLLFMAVTYSTDHSFAGRNSGSGDKKAPDVLIIYSSGTPHETISKMDAEKADAVTCPTPKVVNVKTTAAKLAGKLRKQGLRVRMVKAGEIKHHSEILDARLVVLGSPSYFGNMSWQLKKLMDERFGVIYATGKKRLGSRRVAAFSMAEVESSARETLKTIERALRDCRGVMNPRTTFLTTHTKDDIDERVSEFAEKIATVLE